MSRDLPRSGFLLGDGDPEPTLADHCVSVTRSRTTDDANPASREALSIQMSAAPRFSAHELSQDQHETIEISLLADAFLKRSIDGRAERACEVSRPRIIDIGLYIDPAFVLILL